MKKHLVLTSLVALIATAGNANAISASDINDINESINMAQSSGNYTTSMGDFNAGTTDYSTEAGYGLYTYDHDNNPDTAEIALTTNNGTETLDNTVFTYTDNTGATTDLGANATGFTTSDFTGAAGTIDVADGTTDLPTTLEANTTSVGLGNYQYMANFDNSGDALTALTADAPELSSFHNDITLTTGAITVNGNDEVNKPSIDQYGFTVDLHDGSTGNFDLVYNESTHLYSYNYDGDVVLDATDIAAADAQVSSKSADLIADTTLFNNAVATNTTNYNSTLGHYTNVHGVYESDTNTQSTLNTNYGNYDTSFAEAQANQIAAAGNLSEAQSAYATDLAIYTQEAAKYNNYENSLGKSIDEKDAAVLADAITAANDAIDTSVASGTIKTALDDKADAATTYTKTEVDTALDTKQNVLTSGQLAAIDSGITADKVSGYDATVNNMGTIHGLVADANATQTTNGRAYNGNLAVGTTVEDHLLALDAAIGDKRNLSGDYVSNADVATNLQSLNDGIESEVQRATNAENALQAAIDNINTASVAAVEGLSERVDANTYAISGLNNKVDSLEKNVSGGVAAATALSAVEVSNVKKGEMSVGGGYGYYNSQSAMAFGAALGLTDNWSVNAGAGVATGDKNQVSFRAGTNYKFKLF